MKVLMSVLMLLTLTACGSFKTVTQLEEQTFLQLVGKVDNVVLTLDDKNPILLDKGIESFNLNGKTITKFVISPGQHVVKLERNGQLLMQRKFYVTEGNSVEINIP